MAYSGLGPSCPAWAWREPASAGHCHKIPWLVLVVGQRDVVCLLMLRRLLFLRLIGQQWW